ncbi:hypothetical protein EDC01DRAFT_614622 [Geopyxis carbonaria]|nr:hypothetical protein EDC01DRAFT_614622 [Geopyxis carbonaria]
MSVPSTQKALQITQTGGPDVVHLAAAAPVPTPSATQVLIKNTHAGINYIDTYFRSGLYPPDHFPYTLGREGEGHIVSAPASSSLAAGDRVAYTAGATQAQFAVAEAWQVVKLPQQVPEGVGAASMIQGLTALTMIRESYHVRAGDAVLVHAAAGGVGLWLCQLLRAVGAGTIIATASTAEKLELAKKNGATHGVSYADGADWVAAVKEITGGAGVAAVFDGVGKATFDGDLEVVARKGTVVSFGNASGAVEPLKIARLAAKNVKVLRPQLFGYVATPEEFKQYADELMEMVAGGKVDVRVHKTYKLEEAVQAHKDLEGRGTTGKLLFKIE